MNDTTYEFGTTPKASIKKVREAIDHANRTPALAKFGSFTIDNDYAGMRVIFWPSRGDRMGSAFGVVSNATARECTGLVERIYGAEFLAVSVHRI